MTQMYFQECDSCWLGLANSQLKPHLSIVDANARLGKWKQSCVFFLIFCLSFLKSKLNHLLMQRFLAISIQEEVLFTLPTQCLTSFCRQYLLQLWRRVCKSALCEVEGHEVFFGFFQAPALYPAQKETPSMAPTTKPLPIMAKASHAPVPDPILAMLGPVPMPSVSRLKVRHHPPTHTRNWTVCVTVCMAYNIQIVGKVFSLQPCNLPLSQQAI